jgi:hypothetical protein
MKVINRFTSGSRIFVLCEPHEKIPALPHKGQEEYIFGIISVRRGYSWHVDGPPMLLMVIECFPMEVGTPRGGIISATLEKLTLDGLERCSRRPSAGRKSEGKPKVNSGFAGGRRYLHLRSG